MATKKMTDAEVFAVIRRMLGRLDGLQQDMAILQSRAAAGVLGADGQESLAVGDEVLADAAAHIRNGLPAEAKLPVGLLAACGLPTDRNIVH
jgi:hypothetical protein